MGTVRGMAETYPRALDRFDRQALTACIRACEECAQACMACADMCLSEQSVQELAKCIRSNLDCAEMCTTTGRVLSCHTGDANLARCILESCAALCKLCGDTLCESRRPLRAVPRLRRALPAL